MGLIKLMNLNLKNKTITHPNSKKELISRAFQIPIMTIVKF